MCARACAHARYNINACMLKVRPPAAAPYLAGNRHSPRHAAHEPPKLKDGGGKGREAGAGEVLGEGESGMRTSLPQIESRFGDGDVGGQGGGEGGEEGGAHLPFLTVEVWERACVARLKLRRKQREALQMQLTVSVCVCACVCVCVCVCDGYDRESRESRESREIACYHHHRLPATINTVPSLKSTQPHLYLHLCVV